jgi:hypothetical protein
MIMKGPLSAGCGAAQRGSSRYCRMRPHMAEMVCCFCRVAHRTAILRAQVADAAMDGNPSFSRLRGVCSSPRRPGDRAARNHNAQDCQNKRQRAENEILPTALRDEVGNSAKRHDDSEKPRSPAEQRCIASRTPDARTAEHDQRSSDVDNGSDCARSSLSRR